VRTPDAPTAATSQTSTFTGGDEAIHGPVYIPPGKPQVALDAILVAVEADRASADAREECIGAPPHYARLFVSY